MNSYLKSSLFQRPDSLIYSSDIGDYATQSFLHFCILLILISDYTVHLVSINSGRLSLNHTFKLLIYKTVMYIGFMKSGRIVWEERCVPLVSTLSKAFQQIINYKFMGISFTVKYTDPSIFY